MADPLQRLTWRRALSMLFGQSFGGSRDLNEVCGYPLDISPQDYLVRYLRGGIAARIIDAFPDATWREAPTIKAVGEEDDGPWATKAAELFDQWSIWDTLHRLDLLTSLGHYGVLLLGVAGGQPLTEPLDKGRQKLLYLSPHSERSAEITRWDNKPSSPRFAQPELYRLTIGTNWTGVGGAETNVNAHWSRVIHVTERALDDGAIGTPRLERIWNRLMDLDKLLGGSAEVYWQNAAGLRTWNADADAEWDPKEKEGMEAELEEVMHGLRRDIRLRGVKAELLAATPHDPKGHVDVQLDIIAGSEAIPKRILIGSERGELSSEQDENNWAGRIAERRENHATPKIINPVVDRFIAFGLLPEPADGYEVEWPESDALGEEKRAQIAKTKAEAVQAYVEIPGSDFVVPVQEFRKWLGEDEVSEFTPDDEDAAGIEGELNEGDALVQDEFGQAVGAEAAQDTALNGAQIAAIKDIVEAVGLRQMAPESAIRLLMLGFPLIDEKTARSIIDPMESFTPAEVEQTVAGIDQMAPPTINRVRRAIRSATRSAA